MEKHLLNDSPPKYDNSDVNKVELLLNKYDINSIFSEKLSILENFNIVLLLDDSGSMNTPLDDHTEHATRWDELKEVIQIAIDIGVTYDEDGIDLYFLNREGAENVKSFNQITYLLKERPYGRTPLTSRVREILQYYNNNNKNTLLIIGTDGVPTDNFGNSDVHNLKKVLKERNAKKFYVSFLACSDNNEDISYLNELDTTIENIDTLDDYISEKKEVLNIQGNGFNYSFPSHICRLLLGPICEELDGLDERKYSDGKRNIRNRNKNRNKNSRKSRCSIQ